MKKRFVLLLLSSVIAVIGYAQDSPPSEEEKYTNIRKKDYDQKDAYDAGEYLFPPKPKNNWSIGVKGGLAFISGDVKTQPGAAFGIDVRRALGHAFSLRLQTTIGQTEGLNYGFTTGYRNHNNNPWHELYFEGQGLNNAPGVYYNYRMRYGDISLQGLVNLNNINFYKEQSNWNIFAGAGIGFMGYSTMINALDANGNTYDFSSINPALADPNDAFSFGDSRRETIDALKSLLDDTYETPAEQDGTDNGFKVGDERYVINPVLTGVLGIRYRISRRIEIELEHRISWTNDDLLDGQRWSEHGVGGQDGGSRTALTRDFDSYSHTALGIHFRLGKGDESLWWTNPLTEAYSNAQAAKDLVNKLSEDADEDGIPDLYDQEPDTPEGAIVDSRGRTLDSDGDGYPDSEDDQPFTPKNCEVDSRGVALDSDADGVPNCFDKEPNSAPGVLVDAKGITIPQVEDVAGGIAPCVLPIIHFDLDKSEVKPEFYPELYYIAEVMKADESLTIRATGYADVRNSTDYNTKLSERRVRNVVDFIANTYGIDASRFDVQFKGEDETLIPDLPDNYSNTKLEPLHYVNRRVEFECVK